MKRSSVGAVYGSVKKWLKPSGQANPLLTRTGFLRACQMRHFFHDRTLFVKSPKSARSQTAPAVALLLAAIVVFSAASASAQDRAFLNQYCVGCHNEKAKTAGLMLDKSDVDRPGDNAETWEKVIRKLRGGMMPPSGARRPERAVGDAFVSSLEQKLDRAAAAKPNPGVTALHRLNRTEYGNAVRDL